MSADVGIKSESGRVLCRNCFHDVRYDTARREHQCHGRSGPDSFCNCECEECQRYNRIVPEFVAWEDYPQGT